MGLLKDDGYKYLLISTLKQNDANELYKKIGGKKVDETEFILDDKKFLENIYKFYL